MIDRLMPREGAVRPQSPSNSNLLPGPLHGPTSVTSVA